GVVEGVVQATILDQRGVHESPDLGVAGHVATYEAGLATGRANQLDSALAAGYIHIGNHHLKPFGGEGLGRGPADTGSTAGDQGDLAGERHAHVCFLAAILVELARSLASKPDGEQHYQDLEWRSKVGREVGGAKR